MQSTQILRLFYNAAAAGNELSALFAKALCFGSFLCAEAVLALGCKDIRDAAAVGLYDLLIQIHKGTAKALCQHPAEGGLAGRGHPDQGNVQHIPAQCGSDAPNFNRRILELAVQKIFCGIHCLRHQHFKAAHSHRHARFLGAEDELGLVGVVHHIHHSFKARHGGNVQIAHAYIGVHARRGGVDHDLRSAGNGLGIAQFALFRVRMAADGEHLCRALVPGHSAGGVVGAAGAQNDHGLACKIHAVGVAQVGKAHIIGVIAVEQAVFVHHRVHCSDGLGPRVDVGAVFHHQLFIGDGHIDGLELPLCQKGPGLFLRGQRAQVVVVAAEHLVDDLGVGVAEFCADESVFHFTRPPSGSWWGGSSMPRRSVP